jgi:hypothetical protein
MLELVSAKISRRRFHMKNRLTAGIRLMWEYSSLFRVSAARALMGGK